MATYSSIAWRIPWAEEPGVLWSMGLQRVGHDWSYLACVCGERSKVQRFSGAAMELALRFPWEPITCNPCQHGLPSTQWHQVSSLRSDTVGRLGVFTSQKLANAKGFWDQGFCPRRAVVKDLPANHIYFCATGVYIWTCLVWFFWPHCLACGILVPQPGIKPRHCAVETQSPNH